MINDDIIPLVHRTGLNDLRLNKTNCSSHHKKSLSDISGEFCINFPTSINFWNESGHVSRNSSSNSLASGHTDSQISNITGFEDEINEIKLLSQRKGDDEIYQKICDLSGELKLKNLEIESLSELKRDYQSNLIKVQCQESVIASLKDKIREQYCAIEEQNHELQINENSLRVLNNEINLVKSSELWFKNEFHQSQTEKSELQSCVISLENENLNLKIVCNKLKNNIKILQINSNYIEEKSKNEKELLINKLTDYDNKLINSIEFDTVKLQLAELQKKCVEQDVFLNNLLAENDQLTRQINESNYSNRDLNFKLHQIELANQALNETVIKLSKQNAMFTELNLKLETDKIEMDGSIKKLKLEFDMIDKQIVGQRHELEAKDGEFSKLKAKYDLLVAHKKQYDTKSTNTDNTNLNNSILLIKNDSDDVKKLKILIRVLENEYKVKIKRFEANVRLLLKKIKENFRIRKHLESKYEKCNDNYNLLIAEKSDIIMNLMKIKSLNFNNNNNNCNSHRVNVMPNLNNYINIFIDEYNKLYDNSSRHLIELNSQNSIISNLKCNLASLEESQEKLQIEFKQKEQKFQYESNSYKNQLNTLTETLRTAQQTEINLTHSKHELVQEIKQLNHEIKKLIADKTKLSNLNVEFKENLNLVLQRHSGEMVSFRHNNNVKTNRIDLKKINELLLKSNATNNRKPLEPLKICVDLLKTDMEKLNLIIKPTNNNVRYDLSLMDELKHAEKFNVN